MHAPPPISRRRILSLAPTAAALAAFSPRSAPAAEPDATPRPAPPPLPPPLARDVFRERQERLRAALAKAGLDAVLVVPSTSLHWSASLDLRRSERLMALLVPRTGPTLFVTPAFEETHVRRDAVVDEVKTWREEEDPYPLLARALGKGRGERRVGIEGSTDFHTVERLRAATGVRVVDASGLFDGLRGAKTAEEQALIRDAAGRTERAIAATQARLAEGMTEREVAEILESSFRDQLVSGSGLVQFGPSAALPHGGPGDRRLEKGMCVLIDCGTRVHGYASDVTRTAAFGSAPDDLRAVYATVDAAQRAAAAVFRAGAIPEEVDRAARRVIETAGQGDFFTHRLGHGLGMDGHEFPYLVKGNRTPLVAGNVCMLEPGIYLPGKLGVRIEDDVAARADSLEWLSTRPAELLILKG